MNNNEISDEDYFRLMMQEVKPLKQHGIRHVDSNRKHQNIYLKNRSQSIEPTINLHTYTTNNNPVGSEEIISYYQNELSYSHRKQLQQGQINYNAKLDLHGLNLDLAREKIYNFICYNHKIGNRCVLIIHGKGGFQGETPVLKNHVNDWLKQLNQVLAFHSAKPRHGGTGAIYVLLKNTK